VKVSTVEVKDVELPQSMQRAMARQAEAERERRAKVINADGELQASQRLAEAGLAMSTNPVTLQLRLLQTLAEIATEKNSTIVLPVPFGLFESITQIAENMTPGTPSPRVRVGAPPAPAGDPAEDMTPPERLEPGSREGIVS
jgi:regulator of protease activity HflC (stomatin/prohibitin superfamily)